MSTANVAAKFKWAGIILIALTGLIHLVEAPEYFEFATYLGLSFLVNAAGAALAAIAIYRNARWGWLLGAVIAGGAFLGYIISRSVGLPGLPARAWLEPSGLISLLVEGLFVVLYLRLSAQQPAVLPEKARVQERSREEV